jgi:uncharacterized protein (DUF433 family)
MDAAQSRIIVDPKVLTGKPVIRGTRLSVEFVIGLMADGWSEAEILANYPGIGHDDVIACLACRVPSGYDDGTTLESGGAID